MLLNHLPIHLINQIHSIFEFLSFSILINFLLCKFKLKFYVIHKFMVNLQNLVLYNLPCLKYFNGNKINLINLITKKIHKFWNLCLLMVVIKILLTKLNLILLLNNKNVTRLSIFYTINKIYKVLFHKFQMKVLLKSLLSKCNFNIKIWMKNN